MFISFYINSTSGSVALEYSAYSDGKLMEEFKGEFPSSTQISVDAGPEEYFIENAFQDLAKHLWREFGDVPTDEDGTDGMTDSEFFHFPKGTPVYDVWKWFEGEFNVSVAEDLMGV